MSVHPTFPAPFPDDYRIGQRKVARIRADLCAKGMLDCARTLLKPGYVPEEVMPGRVATYQSLRSEYDRAMAIMETM